MWNTVPYFATNATCILKIKFTLPFYMYEVCSEIPYNRKFSRESNFGFFREQFENAKICLREKLYLKRKFVKNIF